MLVSLATLGPANANDYRLVLGCFTWGQAEEHARRQGGYLATVTSDAEWSQVLATAGDSVAWLGANDAAVEGVWIWTCGPEVGQPISLQWWARGGVPDNVNNSDYLVVTGSADWMDDVPYDYTNAGYGVVGYILETGGHYVNTPEPPTGQTNVLIGAQETYHAASTCSLRHILNYRFTWGDGDVTQWAGASAPHSWTNSGTFSVTAEAQCSADPAIVSSPSSALAVKVRPSVSVIPNFATWAHDPIGGTSTRTQFQQGETVHIPFAVSMQSGGRPYPCSLRGKIAPQAEHNAIIASPTRSLTLVNGVVTGELYWVISPSTPPGRYDVLAWVTNSTYGILDTTYPGVNNTDVGTAAWLTGPGISIDVVSTDVAISPASTFSDHGVTYLHKFVHGETVSLPFNVVMGMATNAGVRVQIAPAGNHGDIRTNVFLPLRSFDAGTTPVTLTWKIDTAVTPPGTYDVLAIVTNSAGQILDTTYPGTNNTETTSAAWLSGPGTSIEVVGALLQGIEVTQCVQNWRNDVPLLENKKTWIIGHIVTPDGDMKLTVNVRLSKDGGLSWTDISRQVSTAKTDTPTGRQSINSQPVVALHDISDNWLTGELDIEMSAPGMYLHPKFAGNNPGHPGRIHVQYLPGPTLTIQPVIFKIDNGEGNIPDRACSEADVQRTIWGLKQLLPVSDINMKEVIEKSIDAWPAANLLDFEWLTGASGGWDMLMAVNNLAFQRLLEMKSDDEYWVGFFRNPNNIAVAGKAFDIPSKTCVVDKDTVLVPAHELGHCLGRCHVNYAGDEPFSYSREKYPYREDGRGCISQQEDWMAEDSYWGFGELSRYGTVHVYPDAGDIMSYAGFPWPSPTTYLAELDAFPAFMNRASSVQPLDMSGERVIISGIIDLSAATGAFTTVSIVAPGLETTPIGSEYHVVLRNSSQGVVATYDFNVSPALDSTNWAPFLMAVPCPADLAAVLLYHGDTLLDTRTQSSTAPSVTLTDPTSDTTIPSDGVYVRWNATDPDSTDLLATVFFSTDGVTWKRVGTANQTDCCYVSANVLMQTTTGRFRVEVSDGFNNTQATMTGTVTVTNSAPRVVILSPMNGARLQGEDSVRLECSAHDRDDSTVPNSAIVWSSDLNGILGTGSVLVIEPSALQEGTHRVSVETWDSQNLVGRDSIALTLIHDQDRDGLPDSWGIRYFGSPTIAQRSGDNDGDGMDNYGEYEADTDPTNKQSYLRIGNFAPVMGGMQLTWHGGTGAWQFVEWTPSLSSTGTTWLSLLTNPPPTEMSGEYTDVIPTDQSRFYRIRATRNSP